VQAAKTAASGAFRAHDLGGPRSALNSHQLTESPCRRARVAISEISILSAIPTAQAAPGQPKPPLFRAPSRKSTHPNSHPFCAFFKLFLSILMNWGSIV